MQIRRTSGRVVELSTVFVGSSAKPRRGKRKGTTSAEKQDENDRAAEKRLARVLNCNFSHGDLLLTVKYDDEGMAALHDRARRKLEEAGEAREIDMDDLLDAAEHEATLYMDRLRRVLRKRGAEMKAVLLTADIDGQTGEAVRIHHHIVMPRLSFEEAAKCWKKGSVDYQLLRDQDDYTPLAVYLCRQVRRRPDRKKYRCTRNMKQPVVTTSWVDNGVELKADRGACVKERQFEAGRPQYLRFVKRREKGRREETDFLTRQRGCALARQRWELE